MAVEVKYVVIREAKEKMSFTSKKEADAYDKMLDTADLLDTWLTNSQCKWKTSNVKPFRYGWQNKKMRPAPSEKPANYRPHRSSVLNPKRKMPHTRPEATCAPDNLYDAFS